MTKTDKEGQRKTPILRFKGFTDDWEQRKIKDTQTILTDGNYANLYPKPTDMVNSDKGVPFLTGGNLKDGHFNLKNAKYITKEKHNQLQSGHLKEDDIVIAVRGSLGELGYVTKQNIDWNINSQLAIIRTFKEELNGNFLLYFFLSSKGKSRLLSRQTGTALKQLPLQQLKTIIIPKIQILEQQKISDILNVLDKVITLYERKLKLLSQVKKYFLDNLFAEKEYPNLRFKGFTDAWEKIKLKDTQTTLTDGNYANLYPKPADMTDADKGIPFLTGGNLKNGILDLENAKYITKEKHSQLKSGHLEEDDIVIAVRGSLGELGYVTKQNIDWNINSQLAIIRTSKNELIGKFLLYFFLSSKGKSKLLSRQTGTALKQLPLQQLKTIVVPKTLLLEQQKISNILKTIDKTISFYKGKQQHFAEIKNTLLNTMFI